MAVLAPEDLVAVVRVHHPLLLGLQPVEAAVVVLGAEGAVGKRVDAGKKVVLQANLVPRRWTAMATQQWEAPR